MSEAGSGSDVMSMKLVANKDGKVIIAAVTVNCMIYTT